MVESDLKAILHGPACVGGYILVAVVMSLPHTSTTLTMAKSSASKVSHLCWEPVSLLYLTSTNWDRSLLARSAVVTSLASGRFTRNRFRPMPVSDASVIVTKQCSSSTKVLGSRYRRGLVVMSSVRDAHAVRCASPHLIWGPAMASCSVAIKSLNSVR